MLLLRFSPAFALLKSHLSLLWHVLTLLILSPSYSPSTHSSGDWRWGLIFHQTPLGKRFIHLVASNTDLHSHILPSTTSSTLPAPHISLSASLFFPTLLFLHFPPLTLLSDLSSLAFPVPAVSHMIWPTSITLQPLPGFSISVPCPSYIIRPLTSLLSSVSHFKLLLLFAE